MASFPLVLTGLLDNEFLREQADWLRPHARVSKAFDTHRLWSGTEGTAHGEAMRRWHHEITPTAEEIFGAELRPTYTGFLYYEGWGHCGPHIDRDPCYYSFDHSVDIPSGWGLWFEDEEYPMPTGTTLAYLGTKQRHERRPNPGQWAVVCVVHWVPESV